MTPRLRISVPIRSSARVLRCSDVAVRKPEDQDRRCRDGSTSVLRSRTRLAARYRLAGFLALFVCVLDVNRRCPVMDDAGDQPDRSPSVDRFAHRGDWGLRCGVLELTAGEPDHERIWCDVPHRVPNALVAWARNSTRIARRVPNPTEGVGAAHVSSFCQRSNSTACALSVRRARTTGCSPSSRGSGHRIGGERPIE